MQYFLGRYEYAMDGRGRMPVPPRFRDAFAVGAVLTQGPDPCLRLFTSQSFEQQAELYTSESAREPVGRRSRRDFFANSFSVDLDGQGRILVPGPLRAYAGLEGSVLVAGAGEWLELWNPERFQSEQTASASTESES